MPYAVLADLLVVVHLVFVAFVVGGEAVIVLGACAGWPWVRNRTFRFVHLGAIVFVAAEALLGIVCPLSSWEWALWRRAGQVVEDDISFIGRLVRDVIYVDLPPWVFTVVYVAFALLVAATLVFVPPRSTSSTPATSTTER